MQPPAIAPSLMVMPFDSLAATDPLVAGGKAAHLATISRLGIRVPRGYVLPVTLFDAHLAGVAHLAGIAHLGGTGARRLEEPSERVGEAIRSRPLSPAVRRAARLALATLLDDGALSVAVRSSGLEEDATRASFAGQLVSTLGVTTEGALEVAVLSTWASAFTAEARTYRAAFGNVGSEATEWSRSSIPRTAVLLQAMVDARVAGVLMTINPVTGDRSEALVESSFGLGSLVMAGEVTPDRVAVDKVTGEIRRRDVGLKSVAEVLGSDGTVGRITVPPERARMPSLPDDQALELVRLGCQLEEAFGCPQDMEWAIDASGLVVVQARPVTVWGGSLPAAAVPADRTVLGRVTELLSSQLDRPLADEGVPEGGR